MTTLKESAKKIYYQNVKPNVDKAMTNPVTAGLVFGIPGAIGSYFYRPYFDASKAKTQDEAYKMARSTGAKTFIWNGKHYNTDYKGNPKKTLVQQKQEELDTYGITNEQTQNKNKITERLHNNLLPIGYDNVAKRLYGAVIKNEKDNDQTKVLSNDRMDLFRLSLGYPQKYNTVGISNYSPTKTNDKAPYYYKLNNEIDTQSYATNSEGLPLKVGENTNSEYNELGTATIGRGKDYYSYYDKWDINPLKGYSSKSPDFIQTIAPDINMLGKPLEIYDRQYNNATQMATGGQLKAQNNAGMTPYLYNSLPQYGLGSWLEENAGTIGSVAGGIGGFLVGGPAGAAIGSAALGGVGNMITQGHANEEKQDQFNLQQQQMSTQNAMNNYNAQQHPMYGTNFAMGGFMPNVNTWQYSNVGGMNYACGGKMANGGQIGNDNRAAQMTKGLDNITVYPKSAGTHESSSTNGIKVGNKGLTEGGETRVNGYIFSNRF